jgi:hypothetical protein
LNRFRTAFGLFVGSLGGAPPVRPAKGVAILPLILEGLTSCGSSSAVSSLASSLGLSSTGFSFLEDSSSSEV